MSHMSDSCIVPVTYSKWSVENVDVGGRDAVTQPETSYWTHQVPSRIDDVEQWPVADPEDRARGRKGSPQQGCRGAELLLRVWGQSLKKLGHSV